MEIKHQYWNNVSLLYTHVQFLKHHYKKKLSLKGSIVDI